MQIYLILIIILGALALKPDSKWAIATSFCLLFTLSALRALTVGTDVSSIYYWQFIYHSDVRSIEYGWYYLRELVALTGSYRLLLVVTSAVILCPVYYVASQHRAHALWIVLLFVLLYDYCYSLNAIRQYISISIVFLGSLYLKSRFDWRFYLCVLIASLFHVSALVMLILPLLDRVKLNEWYVIAALLIAYVVGYFNRMEFMSGILAKYNYGYLQYFSEEYMRDISFSLNRLLLNMLVIVLLLLTNKDSLWLKVFAAGVLILDLFPMFPDVCRIAKYFLIFQILLYPALEFKKVTTKEMRLIVKSGVWVYALFLFFYLLSANVGGVVPYSFAW